MSETNLGTSVNASNVQLTAGDRLATVYCHTQTICTAACDFNNVSAGPTLQIVNSASTSIGEGVVIGCEYGGGTPFGRQPIYWTANGVAVVEATFRVSSVALDHVFSFGFNDFPSQDPTDFTGSASVHAHFYLAGASTDLRARTRDYVSNTDESTGITFSGSHRLRVELHGESTPVGVANSAPTVRFYVDDVLTNEITTNFTAVGLSIGPAIVHWRNDLNERTLYVGPVKSYWSEPF